MRELPFVVVPEEEVQAVRRRGEKALSKAGPLQKPTALVWFSLLGFSLFSYKTTGSKFKSWESSSAPQKSYISEKGWIYCTLNNKSCSFLPYGGTSHKFELHLETEWGFWNGTKTNLFLFLCTSTSKITDCLKDACAYWNLQSLIFRRHCKSFCFIISSKLCSFELM